MKQATHGNFKGKLQLQILQIKGYKNLIFQMEKNEAQYPALTPQIAHTRSLTKGRLEEKARVLSASIILAYKFAKGGVKKLYRDLIKAHLAKEEWWETLFRHAKFAALEAQKIIKRAVRVANKLNDADRENLLNVAKLGLGISLVTVAWPVVGLAINVAGAIGAVIASIFGWQIMAFAGAVLVLMAAGNPVVQGSYRWTKVGIKSGVELAPRLKQLWAEAA